MTKKKVLKEQEVPFCHECGDELLWSDGKQHMVHHDGNIWSKGPADLYPKHRCEVPWLVYRLPPDASLEERVGLVMFIAEAMALARLGAAASA